MSTAITLPPNSLAYCRPRCPRPPTPKITAVAPGWILETLTALNEVTPAHASGAASKEDTASGTVTTWLSKATAYSAQAPSTEYPLFSCDSHSVSQPSTQYEQCPQALPSHAMATRSPALCRLAPGPVSSIMPTPSCPGVNGGFGFTGQSPAAGGVSVWHSPEVCIRTSTWPRPGSGTGSSLISSLAPSSGTTAAFIVLMALSPFPKFLAGYLETGSPILVRRHITSFLCCEHRHTQSLWSLLDAVKLPDATSSVSSVLFVARAARNRR